MKQRRNKRYNQKYRNNYGVRDIVCTKCGRSGHVARDHCFRCGQYGHWAKYCNVKQQCTRCGKFGHIARDHCFRCGEYGHWAKECTQSVIYQKNILNRIDFMDENDKLCLIIAGYSQPKYLPVEVQETIRQYSWNNFKSNSIDCITTAYHLAKTIDEYLNLEGNKCRFSKNKDFNLLQYIYIRGGALRDCYLLRDIKDIDIVIDNHELSKKYLQHLLRYHSKIEQQKDCQCVYWQRYLNKFDELDILPNPPIESTLMELQRQSGINKVLLSENENVNRILALQQYIVSCNYLLNAQFVVDIIQTHFDVKDTRISTNFHNNYWQLSFANILDENEDNVITVDIVDGFGNFYGRFRSFKEFGVLHPFSKHEITNIVSSINAFDKAFVNEKFAAMEEKDIKKKQDKLRKISIAMYPFPINMFYYDFTINCGHIDLQNVLMTRYDSFDDEKYIDYNWENKLKLKQNGNALVNKYNVIAMNDMKKKIINGPDLNVINRVTADFYFWRFVKISGKFIDKINNKTWKIDDKYLNHTKRFYNKWFNDQNINNHDAKRRKFVNKFLKWDIESHQDMINRFKVFRCIGFENNMKMMMKRYPYNLNKTINEVMHDKSNKYKYRDIVIQCFVDFVYRYRDINGTLH